MNGKGRGTSYYWIAAFINEVGFHVGPAFSSPASASTASYYTHYSWVG